MDPSGETRSALLIAPTEELYTDAAIYDPTGFGEIANFMHNKRKKLAVQLGDIVKSGPQIFAGLKVYVTRSLALSELR